MKNDKFLVDLLGHFSNRPMMFFVAWGLVVLFFLYLFLSLQRERNKRYFKDDNFTPKKSSNSNEIVKKEETNGLPEKKD